MDAYWGQHYSRRSRAKEQSLMVDNVHTLAAAAFMDPAAMTAPVHAADARGVVQEVAGSPATSTVYAAGQPSSTNHSSLNTILEALAVMEAKSNDTKKEGEALQEDERVVKKQNVTMAMGVFDCPVCSNPLRPPIFQCTLGHFVCSPCRDKLLDNKCLTCSGLVLNSSCYGMERVVESILSSCRYAEYGCTDMLTYYRKGEHQEACTHGPCFCPEPGCGFSGSKAALLDHFTSQHEWPMTEFKYYVPFDLYVRPGFCVLRGQDGSLFLLNVTLPESPLLAISLVCIQSKASEPSRFGCSVGFSCWNGHYQLSSLEKVPSSSLSDGLPKNCFCFVPKAYVGVRIIIDTELMHDDDGELEEDEDDDVDGCEDDVDDELEEEEDDDDDDSREKDVEEEEEEGENDELEEEDKDDDDDNCEEEHGDNE